MLFVEKMFNNGFFGQKIHDFHQQPSSVHLVFKVILGGKLLLLTLACKFKNKTRMRDGTFVLSKTISSTSIKLIDTSLRDISYLHS